MPVLPVSIHRTRTSHHRFIKDHFYCVFTSTACQGWLISHISSPVWFPCITAWYTFVIKLEVCIKIGLVTIVVGFTFSAWGIPFEELITTSIIVLKFTSTNKFVEEEFLIFTVSFRYTFTGSNYRTINISTVWSVRVVFTAMISYDSLVTVGHIVRMIPFPVTVGITT